MNHYVYEITNNINGMKYIGKRSCHCEINKDKYMGSGKALEKAKKEFGIHNFSKKILAIADNDDMVLDLESYYIEKRNAVESNMYYNEVYGGDVSHMFKHNDGDKQAMVRKRISEKNKGKNAGENSKVAKKVICLNNNKVYISIVEASSKTGVTKNVISKACRCKTIVGVGGKDSETDENLRWMHYDKYLRLIKGESINDLIHVPSQSYRINTIVICKTTKEKFSSVEEAALRYNAENIPSACIYGTKSGIHPVTKEELEWTYYTDLEYIGKVE